MSAHPHDTTPDARAGPPWGVGIVAAAILAYSGYVVVATPPVSRPEDGHGTAPANEAHRPDAAIPETRPETETDAAPDPAIGSVEALTPASLLARVERRIEAKQLRQARHELRFIVREFADAEQHASAMFLLGDVETQLQAGARAICIYQDLIELYPDHPAAGEAKTRFDELAARPDIDPRNCRSGG